MNLCPRAWPVTSTLHPIGRNSKDEFVEASCSGSDIAWSSYHNVDLYVCFIRGYKFAFSRIFSETTLNIIYSSLRLINVRTCDFLFCNLKQTLPNLVLHYSV